MHAQNLYLPVFLLLPLVDSFLQNLSMLSGIVVQKEVFYLFIPFFFFLYFGQDTMYVNSGNFASVVFLSLQFEEVFSIFFHRKSFCIVSIS